MNRDGLRTLLDQVRRGALTTEAAEARLLEQLGPGFEDLGFARVDQQRPLRQGFPEVVWGQGKTPEQVAAIAERIVAAGDSLLVTRTSREAYEQVRLHVPDAAFDEQARIIAFRQGDQARGRGTILVAAAGTSDLPVAEEAAITAEVMGTTWTACTTWAWPACIACSPRRPARRAQVMVVVAGMEGALASVVGGLVQAPVIAVPTSVGYGASFQGLAALLAMLNSCAMGVAVVNIDNGFGAAAIASAINHLD